VSHAAAGDAFPQSADLVIAGIRNPRSLGISRYASSLAQALVGERIEYRLALRRHDGAPAHFHLANSSRALLLERSRRTGPFVITVHDVVPRSRALHPLYRVRVYPQLVHRTGAVVVHSAFAADLLLREAGRPARLEVIQHPARRIRATDRRAARRALKWPEDPLIAVVPGVIKPAKLIREILAAASHAQGWMLALAGRLGDRGAGRAARTMGAVILADPDDADYERALVAADCVLCLRSGSVGETNGPLLDALGAGRAVLATATGSIPEVGRDAVRYCAGTERAIRTGLEELADGSVRSELEGAALRRARELTWEASAAQHAALFREVFGG
jgi:glycosyltransferase involved in cell wall biosynthesis